MRRRPGQELRGPSTTTRKRKTSAFPSASAPRAAQEYDQKTEEYYDLFADDLTADKDHSVFKLGIKGTLKGVEYEIIGRIRYQDEDEWEKCTWDEWFAVAADGSYHYFVEEEGKSIPTRITRPSP